MNILEALTGENNDTKMYTETVIVYIAVASDSDKIDWCFHAQ